jgi:hypothetical protein
LAIRVVGVGGVIEFRVRLVPQGIHRAEEALAGRGVGHADVIAHADALAASGRHVGFDSIVDPADPDFLAPENVADLALDECGGPASDGLGGRFRGGCVGVAVARRGLALRDALGGGRVARRVSVRGRLGVGVAVGTPLAVGVRAVRNLEFVSVTHGFVLLSVSVSVSVASSIYGSVLRHLA